MKNTTYIIEAGSIPFEKGPFPALSVEEKKKAVCLHEHWDVVLGDFGEEYRCNLCDKRWVKNA